MWENIKSMIETPLPKGLCQIFTGCDRCKVNAEILAVILVFFGILALISMI